MSWAKYSGGLVTASSVSDEELLERSIKSDGAHKVLKMMDSDEYENYSFLALVKLVSDETGVSVRQLEKELELFV